MTGAKSRASIVLAVTALAVAIGLGWYFAQRGTTGPRWFRQARAHAVAGDTRGAWEAYRAAEAAGLRTPEFFVDFGAFELRMSASSEAEVHFRKALQIDPRTGPAHAGLAEVYMRRGQWDLAAQEFAVAASLMPGQSPQLYTNAGTLYANLGRMDTAREMFQRALTARPGFEPALDGMARVDSGGSPATR